MKSLWVLLIASALVVVGCQPAIAPTQDLPAALPTATIPAVTPTHLPVDLTPAQRAAIATLAQSLCLTPQQIKLVSTEAVTWPNGCLGVQRLGVLCTQLVVPGFKIILSANGKQYEIHTNQDGTSVAPQEALEASGPAQQVAIKQLASNLGISENDVKLVSSTIVEWPDSCLGTALPGVLCAQVVTPGFLFVLEASGRQYEYHTSQDAGQIMPGSLALDWNQKGGVAGLCENLTIFLSGEIYGTDCKAGGDSRMAVLTVAQRTQLTAWVDQFGTIAVDLSDPKGMTDGMTRTVNVNGTGSKQPTEKEQHAIFDFGQQIYHSLYP